MRHDARGERVVAHRLDRVGLHQPDVLVGRGVEHDRRAVLGEDLAHALLFLAIRQHRGEHRARHVALVLQLALDLEEVVLGVVDEHDLVRLHARDLAAQLRADRAAGARHEHRLARQVGAHPLQLHLHRLAAEHILDAHLAHLPRERAAAAAGLQQLEHGRQRPHRDAPRTALAHDARARGPGGGGNRDDHLVGLGLAEHTRQLLLGVAAHLHPFDPQPALARVVVEKAHRLQAEPAVAHDLAQHQAPAVAGADDQHAALALAPAAERGQRAALVDARARASARRTGTAGTAGRTAPPRRSAAPPPRVIPWG